MRVLVTGGTGFIGSHSVASLLAAGHEVRLLVRSRDRVDASLEPLGVNGGERVDIVEGDATERAAVERALEGCDAVLHAASVYSFGRVQRGSIANVNAVMTAHVLETAAQRGLDPIIHVSSYAALLPHAEPLSERSPVGDPVAGYPQSKAAAERIARRLQGEGAPVVIVHPGIVIGPHDPYVGESTRIVLDLVRQRRPAALGLLPLIDVRDLAAAHVAALRSGLGPRRYVLVAQDVRMADLARQVGRVRGFDSHPIDVPAAFALPLYRLLSALGARLPMGAADDYQPAWVAVHYRGADAAAATRELGLRFRPLDVTLADTIAWLRSAGHADLPPPTATNRRPR